MDSIDIEFSMIDLSDTGAGEPKISDHFYYHELFSKGLYHHYSINVLSKMIDHRIIRILEEIRSDLGAPILVNNWFWKGNLMYRGFRPFSTKIGAKFSQHKFGRAVDFNVKGLPDDDTRNFLISNQEKYFSLGLRRIENGLYTKSWIHIDLHETYKNEIIIFNP